MSDPDGSDGSDGAPGGHGAGGTPDDGSDGGRERDPLLLDAMLGKLTTYLRMCGYDAAYALDRGVEDDDAVLGLAVDEGRRLVTRDTALAARAPGGVPLRSLDVADQLRELADSGFALELADPPRRCSRCNGRLTPVEADADTPSYAPDPAAESVWRCVECDQHFWKGSHWDDVRERLSGL